MLLQLTMIAPVRICETEESSLMIDNAWLSTPDYVIDLVPEPLTAQVWIEDLLLATSTGCLRLEETRHVDRLYFPEADVRWEHFEGSAARTICPFKGEATYWTLSATDPAEKNVVWTYREPFDEVAGIRGYVCFYQERLRVELVEDWPGEGSLAIATTPFPAWGDAADLRRLIDVVPDSPGRFVGPTYRNKRRNVVEGGQMLAQAIVAAGKTVRDQRVTSAFMIFAKSASFDSTLEVDVGMLRVGRTFSTLEVKVSQEDKLRSAGLLLLDSGAPHVIRNEISMPDIGGPMDAEEMNTFRVTGRRIRVIDGAYKGAPGLVGSPDIFAWCQFRDAPEEQYLHRALLAQSTTHWTVAAAMRPHTGFGEDIAHSALSTGVMSIAIAFHEDVDVTQWLLYANPAIYAGHGQAQGEGHVFTEDGHLVATYTVQVMIRAFERDPSEMGLDESNAM
jgi:acyl-CoA thioesterase-2